MGRKILGTTEQAIRELNSLSKIRITSPVLANPKRCKVLSRMGEILEELRMFWKKKPTQAQTISGSNVVGSQIQMTQAGENAIASQSGTLSAQQQGLSGADVVKSLEELETFVKQSGVDAEAQQKILNSVGAAKEEAKRDDADKEMVAKNLKRAGEVLESVNKGAEAGQGLWEKGQEVFGAIAPWLGSAAKLLGL